MTESGHAARRARSRRRWLLALAWLPVLGAAWGLFVGEFEVDEWVAGGLAAVSTAMVARLVMAVGLLNYTFRREWLRHLASGLREVPVDFVILTVALARAMRDGRRDGVGAFNTRAFRAGGKTPLGSSWRALAAYAATWSPNAYLLDIDREGNRRLMHDLVPRPASERPA